ncbi:TRAP transporter fused permease subunit [Cocleimonas sp. KMM 6892]|uniref:TRAP transporter permease n=1 Tax=unclassified Cocleimonas TaxID=2639732 RepID=UPI002DBBC073|nr:MULTISPECIES: TRAP transporter fused permease subunit [unclassified Cocleimonas]MEB8433523.1 TRAP transporter fused permease subunit [Cocleimonas sp. KMM 6892]MEC4716334.1 TRAP transporter fused permease subunit [Cocleimonas sp. KMM 6895]MEC4745773.1 TRAP transporter fused permease subunit [Cocleimonas sp. KMM 6896]
MNNKTQNNEAADNDTELELLASQNLRDEWLMLEDIKRGESKTPLEWFIAALAVAFGVWHILTNIFLNEPGLWQNAIHFAGFAFLASTIYSAFGKNKHKPWAIKLDLFYGLLVAASALWVAASESRIYDDTLAVTGQSWQFSPVDWLAGGILLFAALDLSRRVSGWVIPILILLSLSYIMFLGEQLPGVFRSASLPLNDIMFRSLFNDEGMFGILASISSTNITLFMIFGGFLVVSGASDFVIESSKLVAGRIRGGAAFVAVLSSALTGTISGSAIANTASTGVITIPLMKSNGFRGRFAGGVEAAASTGGQLMPPIMGAGAFVMASYTSIPYSTIVAVSVVPAILYFLSVAFIVRIEAVKYKVGDDQDLVIDKGKIISGGLTFILPLTVMIWLLMTGVTPSYAASWAIAALVLVSWATLVIGKILNRDDFKPTVMGPSRIAEAFMFGIRASILTGVLLVAIGIMNNAIVTSGIGNSFSLMIAQWSQGSMVVAIILIGLASLVLGMGLPVTAAYIILAILSAPALAGILADGVIVDQLIQGITDPAKSAMFMLVDSPHVASIATGMTRPEALELMSAIPFEVAITLRPVLVDAEQLTMYLLIAHLIVFWLSQDSNVTPPVCLAAFTAAGIAKSPPMATGFQAWKIAKGLYIVPLMFAYTPLISGSWMEIIQIGFFGLFGIYALNCLVQNYAEGPLKIWHYPLLILGIIGAFLPLNIMANIVGAALITLVVVLTHKGLLKESLTESAA